MGKKYLIIEAPYFVMTQKARIAVPLVLDFPIPYIMISSYGIPLRYPSIAASPILAANVEMRVASEISYRQMLSKPPIER